MFLEADHLDKDIEKTLACYKIMVMTFINTLYTLVLSLFIS